VRQDKQHQHHQHQQQRSQRRHTQLAGVHMSVSMKRTRSPRRGRWRQIPCLRPDPHTALLQSQSLASSNCEGPRAIARTAQGRSALTAFSLALFEMVCIQSCTQSPLLTNGNGGARRGGSISRWC
jgi:hypothetical protein